MQETQRIGDVTVLKDSDWLVSALPDVREKMKKTIGKDSHKQ